MSKLVCKHCKTELTLNNIKDIEFGRIYETTELGEMDKEVAYIKCSKCGNITETDNETGHSLRTNLINMWRMYHYDILYNFRDIEDLLNNLSDSDKEKIKDCQFKVFEDCTDDDSGDVYCYITIFKGDTEIGKIDMMCYLNTPHDIENAEELIFGELSYSYSYKMKLNNSQEHHIECPNCHNKILGKYWLNVKYQGHDNYGDYEEDIYTGECPVCGQLNNELPYTGIGYQPDDSLFSSDGAAYRTTFGEDKDRLYSADELNDLFKHISDEDREKINDCQFKLDEQYPDDGSGDVYDYLIVYRNNNVIGKIDMQFHSNTYFDLIDMEIKSTDTIPYYTYEMTLYKDSKEESNNIKNTFGNSIFRCKKCGKVFCTCNIFFTNKD